MRPARESSARYRSFTFLLIWLVVSGLFIGAHYEFLFLQPHTEIGDFAANALQIRSAKFFQEIYGNYSRWGFHHPGPGFFYFYAAGEWIFHDLLKAVPSQFNAHMIAGILLQTGLLVWGLAILHHHVRRVVIVPVFLVLAAVHFGIVNHTPFYDSAFFSIWPPHVQLFPFVCFVIACASVAAGTLKDLLPAVFAGCLLVHGHVAQPLFVVPLFVLACIGFVHYHRRHSGLFRASVKRHRILLALTFLILALSLAPLAIDVSRGSQSNLRTILNHMSAPESDHKTLTQSLLYLACFASYEPDPQNYCDRLGPDSLKFLRERWYFAGTWFLILAGAIGVSFTKWNRHVFGRWFSVYVLSALFLTICWGILQSGPMFSFNAHINYGLLFLVLVLVALPVCQIIGRATERGLVVLCSILALPLFYGTAKGWNFSADLPSITSNTNVMPGLEESAKASAGRTKFLLFERDNWGWAASVAIALQRLSFDFAVPPGSALEFGSRHARDLVAAVSSENMGVWRFVPTGTGFAGFNVTPNGPYVISSADVHPSGTEINFGASDRNAPAYTLLGWDFSSEEEHAWSVGKSAMLFFQPGPAERDVEILFDVAPAILPGVQSQRLEVAFDKSVTATYALQTRSTVTLRIPASSWNKQHPVTLAFGFPDATSPLAVGDSVDPRLLGFAFRKITFRHVSP